MSRLEILKTYKIYIGGQFPRTESGRFYPLTDKKGNVLANVCLSSRKDFRNAVVAARTAYSSWSERAAFNRGQILYRIAEILEGRKDQFVQELVQQGETLVNAKKEVQCSIDRVTYFAGWCDKYQQIMSSVNPVSSSHFNFSVQEPMGVISVIADEKTSLIGLVSVVAPLIAGGNTVVALASEKKPLCSITFSEVLATSDVPGGVVNIITGTSAELHEHFSSHMDVNAIIYCRDNKVEIKKIGENASLNVKRVLFKSVDWLKQENENPFLLFDTQEIKTTWHPIENIGVGGAKY